MSSRLHTGDLVIVISGKEKGKTGKVARLMDDGRVIVEGVNVVKRHTRPNPKNQQGGIFEKSAPLQQSKVMPVDPKTGKGTRVKIGKDDKGNKVRIAVKSGEILPTAAKAEKTEAKA